ncbi:MAG: peptide chain release factor N(5)-glutamine methyltransferase [Weeksellaceae bacterium]|nr:peptide chain release factor N(5)-glutamine methyltransferase [Weeksellaceae bacterium]
MTLAEYKAYFQDQLSQLYCPTDSDRLFLILCEEVLKLNRIELRNSLHADVPEEHRSELDKILNQLKSGRPYQQILGKTHFFGLHFLVDENVLIPRPETEELVELAVAKMKKSGSWKMEDRSYSRNLKILDIGTGSGVIPICLKKQFPQAEITAIDYSEKALETAKKNANLHSADINFIHQDYLNQGLTGTFDVIISNPPYIGMDEVGEIGDSVKEFEPEMALFSPTSDALIFYRKIAADAEHHLKENGIVFLEINQKLGKETLALFNNFHRAELLQDLSGNDRFIYAVK